VQNKKVNYFSVGAGRIVEDRLETELVRPGDCGLLRRDWRAAFTERRELGLAGKNQQEVMRKRPDELQPATRAALE
jgi:hypothetical protein